MMIWYVRRAISQPANSKFRRFISGGNTTSLGGNRELPDPAYEKKAMTVWNNPEKFDEGAEFLQGCWKMA